MKKMVTPMLSDSGIRLELGIIGFEEPVIYRLPPQIAAKLLERHRGGDWGDIDIGACKKNDLAYTDGGTIRSEYDTAWSRIAVETSADRTVTVVMTVGI